MELKDLHEKFSNGSFTKLTDTELKSTIGGGSGFWSAFSATNQFLNHLLGD